MDTSLEHDAHLAGVQSLAPHDLNRFPWAAVDLAANLLVPVVRKLRALDKDKKAVVAPFSFPAIVLSGGGLFLRHFTQHVAHGALRIF